MVAPQGAVSDGEFAVDLRGVRKVFKRKVHALRGVDLRIRPGQIFGLLGPNGAGKSTLVKIMMTIVRPTEAQGTMLGKPIGHKPTLARVGFLPEHHRMPEYLTGRQAIDFYGALAGVSSRDRKKKIDGLLDLVGMQSSADRRIGSYSKGMMQRIGLGQALINEPDLIVLDEPTDGVDPVGRRDIRDLLVRMRNEGRSVLVNSHILSELEMVCDEVAIMVSGKMEMQGTLDELTAGTSRVELDISGPPPEWASADPALTVVERSGNTLLQLLDCEDLGAIQPYIDRARADQRHILGVAKSRESLEDLFVRAVGDRHEAGGQAHLKSVPAPSAPARPATTNAGDSA